MPEKSRKSFFQTIWQSHRGYVCSYIYIYIHIRVYACSMCIYTYIYIYIWGCAEKGGCRVPRTSPLLHTPSNASLLQTPCRAACVSSAGQKSLGMSRKTSPCYIPYVTGYVTIVGQGPCYKPIVLARAHIYIYIYMYICIYIQYTPSKGYVGYEMDHFGDSVRVWGRITENQMGNTTQGRAGFT